MHFREMETYRYVKGATLPQAMAAIVSLVTEMAILERRFRDTEARPSEEDWASYITANRLAYGWMDSGMFHDTDFIEATLRACRWHSVGDMDDEVG